MRRMPNSVGLLVAASLFGCVGAACVGDAARLADRPDAGQDRTARLRIAVTLPREGAAQLTSEARFLRLRDIDAESAHVLAGAGPSALPVERLPLGRCVRVSGERLVDDALDAASPEAQVGMLDAGELLVTVDGQADRLAPRYLPDVIPSVSGVVYESEAARTGATTVSWHDGADVHVSALGGPDVGRFDLAAGAPPAPVLTRVAGIDPASGPVVVDRGADLELAWAEAPRGDDALVVSLGGDGDDTLRCRAAGGRLVIPAAQLADVLRGAPGATVQIGVERVRKVPWSAPGLDDAELILVVRDSVAAQLL